MRHHWTAYSRLKFLSSGGNEERPSYTSRAILHQPALRRRVLKRMRPRPCRHTQLCPNDESFERAPYAVSRDGQRFLINAPIEDLCDPFTHPRLQLASKGAVAIGLIPQRSYKFV